VGERRQEAEESEVAVRVTIYALRDPRTGEIRYAGKTKARLPQRLREHLKPSSLRSHTHKNYWLRDLLAAGQKPMIEALEMVDETEWEQREAHHIQRLRGEGCRLTNLTAGGDGLRAAPAEVRAKISAAAKRQWATPEGRAKLLPSRQGRPPLTEETLQRIRDGLAEFYADTPRVTRARDKRRAHYQARAATPEGHAEFSAIAKRGWSDPKRREAITQRMRESWQDPTTRLRRSEKLKALWADPEYREKVMAARRRSSDAPKP
jgi:hypothetical protein